MKEKLYGTRHSGSVSPYSFRWKPTKAAPGRYGFRPKSALGWSIRYGPSGFLVAEGSGFSRAVGMKLFRDLEAGYWKRKPVNRPRKKV